MRAPTRARFVLHQDLLIVLRCHLAAFGAAQAVLYNLIKRAVLGERTHEGIVYNRALIDLARHYGFFQKCASRIA